MTRATYRPRFCFGRSSVRSRFPDATRQGRATTARHQIRDRSATAAAGLESRAFPTKDSAPGIVEGGFHIRARWFGPEGRRIETVHEVQEPVPEPAP